MINLHLIRFNFVSLNALANFFSYLFFADRPTEPTLANHIDEKHKNKWGWPIPIAILRKDVIVGRAHTTVHRNTVLSVSTTGKSQT